MCEIFNRQLSDDAIAFWIEELTPVYGENLFLALREGMREKWMPSVGSVLERTRALIRSEQWQKKNTMALIADKRLKQLEDQKKAEWSALTQQQRDTYNKLDDERWGKIFGIFMPGGVEKKRDDENRGMSFFRAQGENEKNEILKARYRELSEAEYASHVPAAEVFGGD